MKKSSPKRKYVRLTPAKWAEASAVWEIGETGLVELSQLFSVSPRALQNYFAKHAVVKGAKAAEMAKTVEREVFSKGFPDHDGWVERARETRETSYRNAAAVEDLVMAQLHIAQKDPTQALRAASALKALSLAAVTLERTHALRWAALGLAKDSVVGEQLPELIFRDLGAEEIEAFQQRDADDDLGGLMEGEAESPDAESLEDDVVREGESGDDDDIVVEGDEKSRPIPAKGRFDAEGCRFVRDATH